MSRQEDIERMFKELEEREKKSLHVVALSFQITPQGAIKTVSHLDCNFDKQTTSND